MLGRTHVTIPHWILFTTKKAFSHLKSDSTRSQLEIRICIDSNSLELISPQPFGKSLVLSTYLHISLKRIRIDEYAYVVKSRWLMLIILLCANMCVGVCFEVFIFAEHVKASIAGICHTHTHTLTKKISLDFENFIHLSR